MASSQEQTPSALLHVMDEVDDLADRVARLETRTPPSPAAHVDAPPISVEEHVQAAVNAAVKEARLTWEKEKEALEAKHEHEMTQLKRDYHDDLRREGQQWYDTCQKVVANRDAWHHYAKRLEREEDEFMNMSRLWRKGFY
jgi:transketolase